jgi:hypothetical protein
LCKEYQVGGCAAPVPCTNRLNLRVKIMHHRSEEIIRNLHPVCLQAFRKLTDDLERSHEQSDAQFVFRPFEGLRTPFRQEELFRKRPPVTYVGAWHSAHQYGMAVDFVPFNMRTGRYTWDDAATDWMILRQAATARGLVNVLDWDRAHVEAPQWPEFLAAVRAMRTI